MGFMCDPDSLHMPLILIFLDILTASIFDRLVLSEGWCACQLTKFVFLSFFPFLKSVSLFLKRCLTATLNLLSGEVYQQWSSQQTLRRMRVFQSSNFVGMTLLQNKVTKTNSNHQLDQCDNSGQFKNTAAFWPVLILQHHYTSVAAVTVCMCSTDAMCIS